MSEANSGLRREIIGDGEWFNYGTATVWHVDSAIRVVLTRKNTWIVRDANYCWTVVRSAEAVAKGLFKTWMNSDTWESDDIEDALKKMPDKIRERLGAALESRLFNPDLEL